MELQAKRSRNGRSLSVSSLIKAHYLRFLTRLIISWTWSILISTPTNLPMRHSQNVSPTLGTCSAYPLGKYLQELPFQIRWQTNLYAKRSNKIHALPAHMLRLTNLTELDISNNFIAELWDDMSGFTKLEKFIANSNNLEVLPRTIG